MKIKWILYFFMITYVQRSSCKKPRKIVEKKNSAKFENPGQIRDRFKDEISKPEMPERWVDRYKQPYSSFWMDYCAPYHCGAYHSQACGLNRKKMKFKWFQSVCHISLHNLCANMRGQLKYDPVETKFCSMYVILRIGCPRSCEDVTPDPICAIDNSNKPALFVNECAMDLENCKRKDESTYEEVHMDICEYYLKNGVIVPPSSIQLSIDDDYDDDSAANHIIA